MSEHLHHTFTPRAEREWAVDDRVDKRARYLLDQLAKRDTMSSHAAFVRWNKDFDELEKIDLRKVSAATFKRMERM